MNLDKPTIRKIYRIIAFAVLLFVAVQNLHVIPMILRWFIGITAPLILGASIGFVLNVPLSAIERILFSRPWKYFDVVRRKGKRFFAIVITYTLFFGILLGIFFTAIPEIARSLGTLATQIPDFLLSLDKIVKDLILQYPQLESIMNGVSFDIDSITNSITGWLSEIAGDLVSSGFSVVQGIISKISTFFMGLILSIYLLAKKEPLGRQARSLLYAVIPEKRADSISRLASSASTTFSSFISSQVLEAMILGMLTFVTNSLLRFPYAFLISVIIGILALVPIFGAIIGAAIGMVLIAIVNPVQAIFFLIVNIVVQQIENNVIYPRTVGNSIGLPAMWVLIATIIGGNLGSVLGILIAIPLLSVIYVLVRTFVYERLKTLKIPYYKIKR